MGRWFGNAHGVLTAVAGRNPDAPRVRCWPHHFDIATLIAACRSLLARDESADPNAEEASHGE